MKYAYLEKCECANGLGIGVSIFTQGCHFHCPGCHNHQLWSFEGGELLTDEKELQIIEALSPSYIQRFSILGGEPLENENLQSLASLIMLVRRYKPTIKIWLYTGWTFKELLIKIEKEKKDSLYYLDFILQNIDILVDGPFIQEQKDITLAFRGSSNQRILDAPLSMLYKKPIEKEIDK